MDAVTSVLTEDYFLRNENMLNLTYSNHRAFGGRRFLIQGVHVFAKLASSTSCCGFDDPRQGTEQHDQEEEITPEDDERLHEALNWQPPQEATLDGQAGLDDDVNRKWAVYRHLEALAEMCSPRKHLDGSFSNSASTTVATSVPSPSFRTHMGGRSASSFHTYSSRIVSAPAPTITKRRLSLAQSRFLPISHNPDFHSWPFWGLFQWLVKPMQRTTYCVQVDVLDLSTRHPTATLGKRPRRAVDCFGQLSPSRAEDTSLGNGPSQAKNFMGVRYRNNKYWVAEVKPPQSSGRKVHIGQFKTPAEAARARDVACYFYCRDKGRMNYEDSPQIISTLLTSGGRSAEDELSKFVGLDEGEKLKFVKELAKRSVEEQAERLPSTHSDDAKTMQARMRTDISQNRLQITEVAQDGRFESRRSAFEQSGIQHTTSELSDSRLNEAGGTLATDAEHSQLFDSNEWLDFVILEDPSTVQLRSPQYGCGTDLPYHPLVQPPAHSNDEASRFVAAGQGGCITDFMEKQDVWQMSVDHAAGDFSRAFTNLGSFGNMDIASPVPMFHAECTPQDRCLSESEGDHDFDLWYSIAQAMAMSKHGLF